LDFLCSSEIQEAEKEKLPVLLVCEVEEHHFHYILLVKTSTRLAKIQGAGK
jgi:hypothetical protein